MEILLVDDDRQSLVSLGRFLSSEGHGVDGHLSPASALAACNTRTYDLIVSDQCLPTMDGVELIQAVKARQPRIKAILYSGLHSEATLRQARRQGVDWVLGKPLFIHNLFEAIRFLALPLSGAGPATFRIDGKEDPARP